MVTLSTISYTVFNVTVNGYIEHCNPDVEFGSKLVQFGSNFLMSLGAFSQEFQGLWLPKDDLQD